MKKNAAFTLIELLVVIAVLGILASMVLVAIDPAKLIKQSRDSRQMSDLNQIVSIATYKFTSTGNYPADLTEVEDYNDKNVPVPPDSVASVLGASYGYTTIGNEMRTWGYLEQYALYLVYDSNCNAFVITDVLPTDAAFTCGNYEVFPLDPGVTVPTSTPTPMATPTPVPVIYHVSGYIDVQSRPNDSGVTVTFSGTEGTFSATTASSGGWAIDVPSGTYTITADKYQYLSMQRTATISANGTLPTKVLYGGDANDDGTVNTVDINIIGSAYGQTCPTIADVNGDCTVNVLDSALAGGNNTKVEPLVW